MITINLGFAKWARMFGNANITKASLDKLTRHCDIAEIGNQSCRFKHSSSKTEIAAEVATSARATPKSKLAKAVQPREGETTPETIT